MPTSHPMLGDALRLAELLRPSWPQFDTGHLVCEGEDDAAAKQNADADAAAKAAADKEKADADAAAAAKKQEEEFDPDRAKATIAKQRESETKLKAELKAAREKAELYDKEQAAKLSEQEKLAKEAEDAKTLAANAQTELRKAYLLTELAKPEHGIVNAEAAMTLLAARGGVEYGDDGRPSNLTDKGADGKTLLDAFLEANSFLKGTGASTPPPSTDGGAGGAGGKAPDLTAEELEYAKAFGMTPEEYAENKQ